MTTQFHNILPNTARHRATECLAAQASTGIREGCAAPEFVHLVVTGGQATAVVQFHGDGVSLLEASNPRMNV